MSPGFSRRQARDRAEPESRLPPQPWPWRRRAQPHNTPRPLPAASRGAGGGWRRRRLARAAQCVEGPARPGPASRVKRRQVRAKAGLGPVRDRDDPGPGLSGPRRRASWLGLRGQGAPAACCPAAGEGRAGCGGARWYIGSCSGENRSVLV